jgi:hypothetical protein
MFAELLNHMVAEVKREDLLYLNTEHQEATMRSTLRAEAALIVLDNFEHAANPSQIAMWLYGLAGPSRFLIVGRHALHQESYICSLVVPSLAVEDTIAFLRYRLEQSGREMSSITDTELRSIHMKTDGLPEALQFVASQLARNESITSILQNLSTGRTPRAKSLMESIYKKAWFRLEPVTRDLLLHMRSISADGEDQEYLEDITGFGSAALEASLTELTDQHLVQVGGSLTRPLYRLHQFTIDWLNSDLPDQWKALTR